MKKIIDNITLNNIYDLHKQWIKSKGIYGKCADLRDAHLKSKYLIFKDLRCADLRDADLEKADLRNTNLKNADLRYANLRGADLKEADLRGANLMHANLESADLRDADLRGAKLNCSILQFANLKGANLKGADLRFVNGGFADLRGVDLKEVNLTYTNLERADLRDADLRGADLRNANLRHTDLYHANLSMVKTNTETMMYPLQCPEKGSFTGYKKAGGYIVELKIPDDAKRSSATSRMCRCNKAKVVSITNLDGSPSGLREIASDFTNDFIYKIGEIVTVDNFYNDRWVEHVPGIHFFITRDEAVIY